MIKKVPSSYVSYLLCYFCYYHRSLLKGCIILIWGRKRLRKEELLENRHALLFSGCQGAEGN